MTDHTPRDRALAGEVVKLSDQRLAEMQLEELLHASRHEYSELQWLHILNELIAARKEIERLTTRVAELEKERDANADDASALRRQMIRALEEAQRLRTALREIARPGDFTLPAEIARDALETTSSSEGPTP